MKFKRGQIVICKDTGKKVIILGEEDFAGYGYNKPKYGMWELVEYPDGLKCWAPQERLGTRKAMGV